MTVSMSVDRPRTTLVSFLGIGKASESGTVGGGYAKTAYRFTSPTGAVFREATSLFGVAVLKYLRFLGQDVDRWIVLGTSASLWSELHQVLAQPDDVFDACSRIDDLLRQRRVSAADLADWQETLNRRSSTLEFRLCLAGETLDANSQEAVCQALFDYTNRGNRLAIDISHGFRHQPIIASYVVSLMRWTHGIRDVSLFSGVYEARDADGTPVLELPICQELAKAAEAAAIMDLTGNYQAAATVLRLDATQLWFLESTNQIAQAKRSALELLTDVEAADSASSLL